MTIPQIETGKRHDEPMNFSLIIPLPASTPYGNLQLKHITIMSRLDEANRQIGIAYAEWDKFTAQRTRPGVELTNAFELHRFAMEYATTQLRRVADEFIALLWCLDTYRQQGQYPERIEIDSIGTMFRKKDYPGPESVLQPHHNMLRALNDISNAKKHSFIDSDVTVAGADEPAISALTQKHGAQVSEPKFYIVPLSRLVSDYNPFLHDCNGWLRAYAATPAPAAPDFSAWTS
ncbi:hypothetical protein [Pseudomonas sp. PS02290]|uniref:hypothetical protein n=1 Tax=Pseudomonas sp. PS02290 TaxID=2991430 RepID=UPI00249B2965|nr:hypothetical protein [Pseudomonas sp. PS02290]